MQDYEKLGVFYLGREFDSSAKKPKDDLLLYDSRDLVTHAVTVGMTGSGKTGLCIDLIEEAALDGVPSILIDPKGDLANLLLTFPGLSGEEFLPWINAEEAGRKGLSEKDFAEQQAALWKKGLAEWGETGERIRRLKEAAEFVIYTPGSSAGVPVSILRSFAAPPAEILEDSELLQERITTTVTSLLGLLNIQADPLQSREHILISTLLAQMWKRGQDLDLASLIAGIQNPPVTKLGVLDLESFYPSQDRFGLVVALNNLLASPGFSAWLEGVPLEIGSLLHTPQGKPRVAIFSIAHLSDPERMFFVSMLLNQVLGWMRTQSGTTSLRALVYMDEIFGYFPPVANPPSKLPLLTLLKQARAFGVGVVLATQNPVDLDYKGLANAGTWFIGRLQTEGDMNRLMDGLEGAAASAGSSVDRKKLQKLLAALGNRVFLMNNTHEDAPVLFQTRWSLSYLRGPLTRNQIKQLMDPYKTARPAPEPAPASASPAAAAPVLAGAAAPIGSRPTLPAEVTQFFAPVRGSSPELTYRPAVVGAARVHFSDAKSGLDRNSDLVLLAPILDRAVPVSWDEAREAGFAANDLEKNPAGEARYAELPAAASKAKSYSDWGQDLVSWLYGSQQLTLQRSPSTGQLSRPGESEREFRVRLQQEAREQRDEAVADLRQKYSVKINTLQERIRKAEQAVEREADQAKQAKLQTAVSFGATLLGAFAGRKLTSSTNITRAGTAMRGVSRSIQQQGDVGRAKDTVEAYQKQLEELNAQFQADSQALEGKIDPSTEAFEPVIVKPKKADIDVQLVALVWTPYRRDAQGGQVPAW